MTKIEILTEILKFSCKEIKDNQVMITLSEEQLHHFADSIVKLVKTKNKL